MERLHQVASLLLFGGCYLLTGCTALAEERCSLVVSVKSPDGRRLEAPITVHEASGRVEEGEQEDTDVRFCDLGILPVTVTVGSGGRCNQVTVRDVPISLDETYLLTVTYDPFACSETIRTPTCKVLFRVADSVGRWVKGAQLKLFSPMPKELTTDEFGRARFVLAFGEQIRGTASAASFGPTEFNWTCSRLEPLHEQLLKMEKR
jgi:hypothetical protein